MLAAIASVVVVVPIGAVGLWLGLRPADESEHPRTGEFLALPDPDIVDEAT